jgi:hypothetical protein
MQHADYKVNTGLPDELFEKKKNKKNNLFRVSIP